MEEPRRRDVDILGWGVGGGFVRVELFSGVVPGDPKSGEYVSLGMGPVMVSMLAWVWGLSW